MSTAPHSHLEQSPRGLTEAHRRRGRPHCSGDWGRQMAMAVHSHRLAWPWAWPPRRIATRLPDLPTYLSGKQGDNPVGLPWGLSRHCAMEPCRPCRWRSIMGLRWRTAPTMASAWRGGRGWGGARAWHARGTRRHYTRGARRVRVGDLPLGSALRHSRSVFCLKLSTRQPGLRVAATLRERASARAGRDRRGGADAAGRTRRGREGRGLLYTAGRASPPGAWKGLRGPPGAEGPGGRAGRTTGGAAPARRP